MLEHALIEPIPIIDIYSDGISHVENLGGCFRTVYFTWSRVFGTPERIVVARLVRPNMSLLTPHGALSRMVIAAPTMIVLPGRHLSH